MKREEIKEILIELSKTKTNFTRLGTGYQMALADVKSAIESLNVEKEQPNHKTQAFEVDKVEAKEVLPMPKESLDVEELKAKIDNIFTPLYHNYTDGNYWDDARTKVLTLLLTQHKAKVTDEEVNDFINSYYQYGLDKGNMMAIAHQTGMRRMQDFFKGNYIKTEKGYSINKLNGNKE